MAKMKKAADGYTNYGAKAGTPSPVTDYAGKAGKQDSYTQYKKGGVIKKKAQAGIEAALEAKTAARNTKGPEFRPGQVKRMNRVFEANPERGVKVAKRMLKRANAKAEPMMKKGGKAKAEKGGAFGMLSVKAGVDKNPKPTAADRIAGAKGLAKKGKTVGKKMKSGGTVSMQLGSYTRQIGKNYSGKAKMGKSVGKCKNGC